MHPWRRTRPCSSSSPSDPLATSAESAPNAAQLPTYLLPMARNLLALPQGDARASPTMIRSSKAARIPNRFHPVPNPKKNQSRRKSTRRAAWLPYLPGSPAPDRSTFLPARGRASAGGDEANTPQVGGERREVLGLGVAYAYAYGRLWSDSGRRGL